MGVCSENCIDWCVATQQEENGNQPIDGPWRTSCKWSRNLLIVGGIFSVLKSILCILHDRKSASLFKTTVTEHTIDNMYWAQTKNKPFYVHWIFLVQPTASRSNGFLPDVTETVTVYETLKTNLSVHSLWTLKISLQLSIYLEQQEVCQCQSLISMKTCPDFLLRCC